MALTEGSSPHRRYTSMFSDDEDQHFGHETAPLHSAMEAQGSGQQGPVPVQQLSLSDHDAAGRRQSGDRASSARYPQPLNMDALSEGCCSMMTLDNGVSSPGANAGSDASMMSRCNSAEAVDSAVHDSAAVQSALIGRKRSSSKLNPPKEEDRTLPLKKLFENLSELSDVDLPARQAAAEQCPLINGSAVVPLSSAPKAASVAGDLPHLDVRASLAARRTTEGALHGLGATGRVPSVSDALNGVVAKLSPKGSPMRSSRTTIASPAGSVASFARNPWSSCDSLHQGNGTASASGLLHNLSQVRSAPAGFVMLFTCRNPSSPLVSESEMTV